VLGQRFALVRELIQLQVEILQVQQPALDGGLGVQGRLLRSGSVISCCDGHQSRSVQASVQSVEM
jgi:hypothetical protein